MTRVHLPPGCAGFADGDWRVKASKPGGFVNLDETDPVEKRQLAKLRNQDYAQAGLVDCGAEKFFVRRGPEGRWCPHCPANTIWHGWTKHCPDCGGETIPESQMARDLPEGQYQP